MQGFDSINRQRALHELGLGPLWSLRQTENISPLQAVDVNALVAEDAASPVNQVLERPPKEIEVFVATPNVGNVNVRMPIAGSRVDSAQASVSDVKPAKEQGVLVSAMSWEELQPVVEACVSCGLCEGRRKAVFGTGDKRAKWLFVGEGPGYNENLQGLPFVGAAGQLLDNMLKALGVQRGDQAYIANIVKCRPTDTQGKDRPPTADEIAACLPYLHRQIALIQPQVIVALGKTAAVSLLGVDLETPIGQLRGKLHHFQDIPMVATYHPAYLLRKPTDKSKAWADLCLALQALPSN